MYIQLLSLNKKKKILTNKHDCVSITPNLNSPPTPRPLMIMKINFDFVFLNQIFTTSQFSGKLT